MPIRRRGRDQPRRVRLDIDGRAEGGGDVLGFAVESFRIGTGNPHAGRAGEIGDGVLHRGAVAALLGKSRRDDHRIPDAGGGAFLERAEHRARRNDDDGEIDRLPDRGDRRIAFQPIDIAVIGIDRVELAGKFVLAQHRQQPARDFLLIARCADQGDAIRREERVERMRHLAVAVAGGIQNSLLFPRISAGRATLHDARWNVTPPSKNESSDTA